MARYSKQHLTESRARIVAGASRLLRERGFDGVSVAELMQHADLTHGGFYRHFSSKEALADEACRWAFAESKARLVQAAEAAETSKADPLRAVAEVYLSKAHRDNPAHGCPIAALGSEAARSTREMRDTFTEGVVALAGFLEPWIKERTPDARRTLALAVVGQMVGAMVLARAVDDDQLSDEILAAARKRLTAESEAVPRSSGKKRSRALGQTR